MDGLVPSGVASVTLNYPAARDRGPWGVERGRATACATYQVDRREDWAENEERQQRDLQGVR